MANKLLTEILSEPLNGTTSAKVEISSGPGHLTIDELATSEPVLASGTLEYLEKQGEPTESLHTSGAQAVLSVRSGAGSARKSWFSLPWSACGGAYAWRIHLNPAVRSEITARSDGGNVKVALAAMPITRLSVENGGGNVDVVLPERASGLSVLARTGGGNVTVEVGGDTTGGNDVTAASGGGNVVVRVPSGLAARITATTGLGKAIVDPRYAQTAKHTYESPDFATAASRVELSLSSGAGNVVVEVR